MGENRLSEKRFQNLILATLNPMNAYSAHVTAGRWKGAYRLTMEIGTVLSLLLVITFFHLPLRGSGGFDLTLDRLETVQLEDIRQTTQPPKPPPPRAQTPIVVPDESLPDEEPLDLDATLDLDAALEVPALPPPPPAEIKLEQPEDAGAEIFVIVEEMPTIIGGVQRLYEIIEYPEIARQAGMEGIVVVQFVVSAEGRPIDLVVTRSAGGVLDRAALDAIARLEFTPGRQRQKPVAVRFAIPVRFELDRR